MNPHSNYGMAIGNLTAQAASNLNLSDFDNYVVNDLKLKEYVRYVDDLIIISTNKKELINAMPKIKEKLKETNQLINDKKSKVDTAYHGVKFLGKISYPYGYQKASKQVNIRINNKARNIEFNNIERLLAKTKSQIGVLKNYNCRRSILSYANNLPIEVHKIITFDNIEFKFKDGKNKVYNL